MISFAFIKMLAQPLHIILILGVGLLVPVISASAQVKDAQIIEQAQNESAQSSTSRVPKSTEDLIRSAELYKSSLQDLLVVREDKVKQLGAQLVNLKELYRDGLISKRDLEENEKELVEAQAKVAEVRRKIDSTNQLIAEASAESEAVEVLTPGSSSNVKRVAYFRYNGTTNWSLPDAAKIESYFVKKFGRRLPVSALGQSDLHNRWGYDHRNAMDVDLHPDSREGQALIAYLQSAGISFMAFRRAVPGSATGPHIHIGRPSHRLSSQ